MRPILLPFYLLKLCFFALLLLASCRAVMADWIN
jgi:hypothetical protein